SLSGALLYVLAVSPPGDSGGSLEETRGSGVGVGRGAGCSGADAPARLRLPGQGHVAGHARRARPWLLLQLGEGDRLRRLARQGGVRAEPAVRLSARLPDDADLQVGRTDPGLPVAGRHGHGPAHLRPGEAAVRTLARCPRRTPDRPV